MANLKIIRFLIVLTLTFTKSFAITIPPKVAPPPQSELHFVNEFDNFFAPFLYKSSLVLLAGGTATYLFYRDRFENKRFELAYPRSLETWHEVGHLLGWGILPISYGAYQYFNFKLNGGKEKINKAEYVIKSVAYTGIMTGLTKLAIDQPRPKDNSRGDSFPSGHASAAFSFSTAIWLTHGWEWGIPASLVASFITYSRIDDGSHYYHDSIAGASLGIAYAIGIYNNHFERDLPFLLVVTPTEDRSGARGEIKFNF